MPPKKTAVAPKSALKKSSSNTNSNPTSKSTTTTAGGKRGKANNNNNRTVAAEQENDFLLAQIEREDAQRRNEHILAVRKAFEKAHQSAASHEAQRKVVIELAKKDKDLTMEAIHDAIKEILPMPIASDQSQRNIAFLEQICKSYLQSFNSDELQEKIINTVLAYHNAADKIIRERVCHLLSTLITTLRQGKAESSVREKLYEDIISALQHRCFDKQSSVREKAVSCISCFQNGDEAQDITQLLLCIMCEDSSPGVRKATVLAFKPKEFLFPHLIRMTADSAAIVRKTAWDKLSKYNFADVAPIWKQRRLNTLGVLGAPLSIPDETNLVKLSHSSCLKKWLMTDMKGNIVQFFTLLDASLMTDEVTAERLASEMYNNFIRKPKLHPFVMKNEIPDQKVFSEIAIALQVPLNPHNVLLWRIYCRSVIEDARPDEVDTLLPLSDFGATFKQAQQIWCQDETQTDPKKQQAFDFIMVQLLKMYEVYLDGGYLAHADDTTRMNLEKDLKRQLSATSDDDPSLYVYESMVALKALTQRDPERLINLVNETLKNLWNAMMGPRQEGANYEDVEGFARADAKIREQIRPQMCDEHGKQRDSTALEKIRDGPDGEQLSMYMDDHNYMLRMQRVIHCYLSECQRGEAVPPFCSHIIALGRAQGSPDVKALATYSLGIQCLAAPMTVHTFLPLLVKDIQDALDDKLPREVGEAALGVVVDLVAEYGFKFFASGDVEKNNRATTRASGRFGNGLDRGDGVNEAFGHGAESMNTQMFLHNPDGNIIETQGAMAPHEYMRQQQLEREREQEEANNSNNHRLDDCHKFGAHNLLSLLHRALAASPETKFNMVQTAALGMCKLLACNRLPAEEIVPAVTHIFMFISYAESATNVDTRSAEYAAQCSSFMQSYAYSQPKRQAYVGEAALVATRFILFKHTAMSSCIQGVKMLNRLADLTDASMVEAVRNVDPTFAYEVSRRDTTMVGANDDTQSVAGAESVISTATSKKSAKKQAKQNDARLWQELYRCSLHEHVAMELLIDLCNLKNVICWKIILDCLAKLHFFKRDENTQTLLSAHVEAASQKVGENSGLQQKLEEFKDRFDQRIQLAKEQTNTSLNASTNASAMMFGVADQSLIYDDTAYDPQNVTFISPMNFADRSKKRIQLLKGLAGSLSSWANIKREDGSEEDPGRLSGLSLSEAVRNSTGANSNVSARGSGRVSGNVGGSLQHQIKQEQKEDEDDDEKDAEVDDTNTLGDSVAAGANKRSRQQMSSLNDEPLPTDRHEDDDEEDGDDGQGEEEDDVAQPPAKSRRTK